MCEVLHSTFLVIVSFVLSTVRSPPCSSTITFSYAFRSFLQSAHTALLDTYWLSIAVRSFLLCGYMLVGLHRYNPAIYWSRTAAPRVFIPSTTLPHARYCPNADFHLRTFIGLAPAFRMSRSLRWNHSSLNGVHIPVYIPELRQMFCFGHHD